MGRGTAWARGGQAPFRLYLTATAAISPGMQKGSLQGCRALPFARGRRAEQAGRVIGRRLLAAGDIRGIPAATLIIAVKRRIRPGAASRVRSGKRVLLVTAAIGRRRLQQRDCRVIGGHVFRPD